MTTSTEQGGRDQRQTGWVARRTETNGRVRDGDGVGRSEDAYAAAELDRRHERTEMMIRKAREQLL